MVCACVCIGISMQSDVVLPFLECAPEIGKVISPTSFMIWITIINLCSYLNFVVRLFCIWRRIISISLRPDVTVHDPSKIKQMHLNFQPLFHIKRIVARQIHQNNVLISFLFRLIANILLSYYFGGLDVLS